MRETKSLMSDGDAVEQCAEEMPLPGLPPRLICRDCQRAAADHIESYVEGLGAVFLWCPETRRGLFLRSWDGKVEEREVSKPGEKAYLERICVENWERWLAVAEVEQARLEFADHDGPVH